MTVAVISDLHDNTITWGIINKILAEKGITTLFNCGDTCAPAMVQEMSQTFAGDIHTVFGNVADRELETAKVKEMPNVHHYGDQADFNLEGKHIALTHFPNVADRLAASGEYDLVCHGHTHLKRWERLNRTFILNPGTAAGMFQYPSFAFIDLQTMSCAFQDITL